MVLLSLHDLAPAQIAALLDCHPATVRPSSQSVGRRHAHEYVDAGQDRTV
jgi:hypothetical protein